MGALSTAVALEEGPKGDEKRGKFPIYRAEKGRTKKKLKDKIKSIEK